MLYQTVLMAGKNLLMLTLALVVVIMTPAATAAKVDISQVWPSLDGAWEGSAA